MKPQLQLARPATWRRDLPLPGRVLVRPGDTVSPDAPVAEADVPVAPIVINLENARVLVKEGQTVHAGVVVAERKKLLGQGDELRSPVAGTVLEVTSTELLLQPPPLTTTLHAQLPGCIVSVRDNSSVEVEGCYVMLRGRGQIRNELHGTLGEDIAIVAEPLTISQLHALSGQRIRAVVAASWADDPEPTALTEDIDLTVFLTERRPTMPMAPPIAQALQAQLGRPAAIGSADGSPQLAVAAELAAEDQCLGPGSWVRLADGRTGKLTAVGHQPHFFPSGLLAVSADVDLGDTTEMLALDSLEWIA